MTKEMFDDVTNWQRETFGQATALSKIGHLAEEMEELVQELKNPEHDPREAKKEFADCFILLFGAASSYGLTYEDICRAVDAKMVINKGRTWGKPNDQGIVNHVRQEPATCSICGEPIPEGEVYCDDCIRETGM